MRLPVSLLLITSFSTVAPAHTGVHNPAVMARMETMLSSKQAVDRLVAMIKGKAPFERRKAREAKAALIANIKATPKLFKERQIDPKSEALPGIWTNWKDFERRNRMALRAARALDVSTPEALQPGLLKLGAKCLDCHQTYREIRE